MRKAVALLLGCAALVLLGGYVVLWLTGTDHRVSLSRHSEVQPGMTRAEAEGILGAPPGNYATGPVELEHLVGEILARDPGERWDADEGMLVLWFDADGKVENKYFVDGERVQETFIEKLRQWLGLWSLRRRCYGEPGEGPRSRPTRD